MNDLLSVLHEHLPELGESLAETGYMLLVSLASAVVLGLPLGMLVFLTRPGGLAAHRGWFTAAWIPREGSSPPIRSSKGFKSMLVRGLGSNWRCHKLQPLRSLRESLGLPSRNPRAQRQRITT